MKHLKHILVLLFVVLSISFGQTNIQAEEQFGPQSYMFEKTLSVDEHVEIPEMDFSYEITPCTLRSTSEGEGKLPIFNGVKDGVTMETITFDKSDQVNGEKILSKQGKINVDPTKFTKPGVYRYNLKEKAPDLESISKNDETYLLDVFIAKEGKNLVTHAATIVDQTEKNKVFRFASHLTSHDFYVTKKVVGNFGDEEDAFNFKMTISNKTAGDRQFKAYVIDGEGIDQIDPVEVNKEYSFSLKHNQKIHVFGVLSDDKIEVQEVDANKNGYTTSLENDFDYVDKDGQEMVFINTREHIVKTGVKIDIRPYVMMITVALAGGFYTLKK